MNVATALAHTTPRTLGRIGAALIVFGALVLTVGLMWIATSYGLIGFYHGLNSGVTLGHWGGFEVSGTPGFFACDGQC